jgi:tRNA-dihydrouridine synthase B
VRIARKHVGWYLQNRPDYRSRWQVFKSLQTPAEQLNFIEHYSTFECNEELAA